MSEVASFLTYVPFFKHMKKRYLLLLLLVACAVEPQVIVPETIPEAIPDPVMQIPIPQPVQPKADLYLNIDDYVIAKLPMRLP